MSTWQIIKEYINNKKIGDILYRQELIHHVYKGPMPKKYRGSCVATLDNYRKLLTKLKVLEHIGRGEYRIEHHIRKDLKTTHLQLLVKHNITCRGNHG